MLELNHIRENKAAVLEGLKKRNLAKAEELIDQTIELDAERRVTQGKLDSMLAESNKVSKEIGKLMQTGEREKAEEAKRKTGELKTEIKDLSEKMQHIESELQKSLYEIPNVPNKLVPAGTSAEDNEVILESGNLPKLAENAKAHWDLIKEYDIIDFDLGSKIAGAGFPVYKGQGARLQRALINFFLDKARDAGYTEIQPPIFINEDSGYGTGQLPDKEGQMYHMEADKLYAIPTAEVPITNIYRGEILNDSQLPVMNAGYTPCFRREAGAWGANVRGLNRLHQFDKVEIVQITYPEKSYETLEKMKSHIAGLLEDLELPYRILNLCAGDLGFTSAQTFDFEVFSGAQKKWLEVSSVSNFETFQANRLKLRYKNEQGKSQLLHTLNGSALALPRIIAALLENNQTDEGIVLPEKIRPYTGFNVIK